MKEEGVLEFCEPSHADALLKMYLTFEPRGSYGGLPSRRDELIKDWISGLTGDPLNLNLVFVQDGVIAGHCCLVYDPRFPRVYEIVIFVHQGFQHKGLGKRLFLATMKAGCMCLELKEVWLLVDWGNRKARDMYEKLGFSSCPSQDKFDHRDEIRMRRLLGCTFCRTFACEIWTSDLM